MSVSVSEWSRLSWKLEEGDEAAYGAGDEGLWLVTQAATTGWPQLSPWILCLVLGLRWVVGALAGLPSYCWDRKPKKITRCPQVAERLQQRGKGFLPHASPGTSQRQRQHVCHRTFQPW